MQHTVLVIGSGGREHAICWKLSQSPHVKEILVVPGNIGIKQVDKVQLVELNIKNTKKVAKWSKDNNVDLVVVGPEDPLAQGLADDLKDLGVKCFGPQKQAAQIEANKYWAKHFMDRNHIPTARWKSFMSSADAKNFVKTAPFKALVVKASGLAAGKGVVVAKDQQEACHAIDEMLNDKKFGAAGETIVIEELLEGEEVSVLAFTDGKTFVPMMPAQDHKRIFNGDVGPNTGGMGAYCPCPLLNETDYELIKMNILQKAIEGLKKENIPFVGILYAGLMITEDGPKVLEFNCRFGDPETEVILPLLTSDLFTIMKACCEGTLSTSLVSWRENISAVGVILASYGYPASSSKGQIIMGIDEVSRKQDYFVFHSGTAVSEGELVTNGGRVLITVNVAPTLAMAAAKATQAAQHISFDGKQIRTDIAHKGIARSILQKGQLTYKSSGVDIDAGDHLVSAIKPATCSTKRAGTLGTIGGFGGLFDVKAAGYNDPILVSGTDGVGTKLKLAIECNKHDTIGIDLVAMCVNDILAHNAEPLFFMDYFACGKLDVEVAKMVVNGIAEGCKQARCSLIGGETAEMPDMYSEGEYDLAGFAVGAVEKNNLLPRINDIEVGDVVIGLASSGMHSNGFSLVRKVLKLTNKKYSDIAPFSKNNRTIGEELLEPTKIYVKSVIPALRTNLVKGFAHITGGGLIENIPRILKENLSVMLDATKWNVLPIFGWLAAVGQISKHEMLRTFNCGIGAILICSKENKNEVLNKLKDEHPVVIGSVNTHYNYCQTKVHVENFEKVIELEMKQYIPNLVATLSKPLKRVGVMISGSGTNLQSLIDATQDPSQHIGAEIVIVISNKSNVEGLKRAERAGIKTIVIKHNDYPSRESFDAAMNVELHAAGVEIVCLAGFMRILSEEFVKHWKGALLNIHPSLLPSFKGINAHKDVLAAHVRVSGCTVHFVEVDIDSGAIIEQETVPVFPDDTEKVLQERVKTAEHRAYPRALKHLATGRIKLREDGTLQWN